MDQNNNNHNNAEKAINDITFGAYTIKLPNDQMSALQSIWLELKKSYGTHSPDKSAMIQQAISIWLQRWESDDRSQLLEDLLLMKADSKKRQYRRY